MSESFEDIVKRALDTYKERSEVYTKQGYLKQGEILSIIFPDKIYFGTPQEHNRMLLVNYILTKFLRYCENIKSGGHQDSIHDIGVYAFLLEEYDAQCRADTQ